MPSKWSATCEPLSVVGTRNVVRYHHDTRKGLSGGMGSFEKLAAMGYEAPGMARRFIPTYGSLYTPAVTSAPTTVEGTVAGYQPRGANAGRDMTAPPLVRRDDDWIVQRSCSMARTCVA